MTSEERLAIAEELLRKFPRNIYVDLGDGVTIGRIEMQSGPKWRGYRDGSDFWLSEDPIEVVYKARQKLAAERDAKKSPREKRLEEACARILRILEPSSPAGRLRDYLDDARKALKED